MTGSRRGRAATVAIVVSALTGATCVGIALGDQQHPPEPPLSAASEFAPAGEALPHALTRHPTSAGPGRRAVPSKVAGPVLPPSLPTVLAIPAIGVRSTLLHLGQTSAGLLEVPAPGPHYNQAGWYRFSPAPGSLGPAVIAGHVDSAAEGPSVFFRLGALRPHDTVLVTRADGSVAIFAVDKVRRFAKTGFPSQLVYGNTSNAALRLITCGGAFNRKTGHYVDNIVVLASLVRSRGTTHLPSEPAS
jgi:hypothetical protein